MASSYQLVRSPLQVIPLIKLIIELTVTDIVELLRLRRVNRIFREAIDGYMQDLWSIHTTIENVKLCFSLKNPFVLKRFFLVYEEYRSNELVGKLILRDLRECFLSNRDPQLDDIYLGSMEPCVLNSTYEVGRASIKTLLIEAIEVGMISKIEALLRNGADPNLCGYDSGDENAPIDVAIEFDRSCEILKLLIGYGATGGRLNAALSYHRIDALVILIKIAGPERVIGMIHDVINGVPDYAARSMPLCQLEEQCMLIRLLVEYGDDLALKDRRNRSPFEKVRHPMVLRTLIDVMHEKGLDLIDKSATSPVMKNAVTIARYHPREGLEMIRMLIEEGIDPKVAKQALSIFDHHEPEIRIHYSIEAYIEEQIANSKRSDG